MVNLSASLPSIKAWERMSRASSGSTGSTSAIEFQKAWVYRPKKHAEFSNRNAKLEMRKSVSQKFPVSWIPYPVGR